MGSGPLRVVISHENITALKIAESRLRQSQEELRQKSEFLEDANTALRVLLRQRDKDRRDIENSFYENIKQVVGPYMDRLKLLEHDSHKIRVDCPDRVGLGGNNQSFPAAHGLCWKKD